MAGNVRLKGQNASIEFFTNGASQTFGNIRSSEVELQLEILTEEYLGSSFPSKEMVYNGIKGRLTLHLDKNDKYSDLLRAALGKATDVLSETKFNVVTKIAHPGGSTIKITATDVVFDGLPLSFAGRKDYGEFTISYETGDQPIIAVA